MEKNSTIFAQLLHHLMAQSGRVLRIVDSGEPPRERGHMESGGAIQTVCSKQDTRRLGRPMQTTRCCLSPWIGILSASLVCISRRRLARVLPGSTERIRQGNLPVCPKRCSGNLPIKGRTSVLPTTPRRREGTQNRFALGSGCP